MLSLRGARYAFINAWMSNYGGVQKECSMFTVNFEEWGGNLRWA